jgi:hypothetical protein
MTTDSSVQVFNYSDWAQFKHDVVIELFPEGGRFRPDRYLFRGMSSADHQLCSKFDRRFTRVSQDHRMRLWDALTTEWRRRCEDAGVDHEILTDDHKLLALGQHFGLPTRLLDWTTSPYVAAFFAFSGFLAEPPRSGQSVAVWVLHLAHPAWSGEFGVEVVTAPSVGNIRMRNQSGRFTLARTPFGSLEEYARQFHDLPRSRVALSKCIIPAIDAITALADLDAMGINSYQLFPDLEGLAGLSTMRITMELAFDQWILDSG